jgi:hypothetical protein
MHAAITHLHITNAFHQCLPTIAEYNQGWAWISDSTVLMIMTSYTFFHDNKRPWGNVLPYQCPACRCICTWQCTTSNLSLLNETKCTCHKPGCGHTIAYNKPLQQEIILFTPGYHGINLSGKIVRKGSSNAGSGWLVSKAIESGVPADDHLPSCKYILIN